MSWSQTAITKVNRPIKQRGELHLSWESTAPAGTWYQVYVGGNLQYQGPGLACTVPAPSSGSTRIDIGTVARADAQTRFTTSLAPAPQNRVTLSWIGGMFLDDLTDVAGYYVYEATPSGGFGDGGFGTGGFGNSGGFGTGGFGVGGFGGATYTLNTSPLATVPAYINGVVTSGFGCGGFGVGGFGNSSATYSWTSDPLTGGTWTFGVAAFDVAGNVGVLSLTSVTITAPPAAPALFSDGERLHYLVAGFGAGGFGVGGFGESVIELSWNPSPST
jgi:hypothetical protein